MMEPCFAPGAVVLFQGDSTTDCGRDYADPRSLSAGYPGQAAAIYQALFPSRNVTFYNRGVSGNRMADLLDRYEADFAALKPDFVSILIGINDTWRRYDAGDPTPAQVFGARYETLLKRLKADFPAVKLLLMEPFLLPVREEQRAWREDLDPKIQEVRRLAARYADCYLPLDGILNAYALRTKDPAALAADGIHPTELGNGLIARAFLGALKILD